jgi:aquaporin Z
MTLAKKCIAEFIGTFWLVFGGCGSAVLAAAYTDPSLQGKDVATQAMASVGIGTLGVSLAFGLTVLTMAYAIGHISGCHLNPAVSFGLWAAKRFPGSELLPYIAAQVMGAISAAVSIVVIASGNGRFGLAGVTPLATNGFGSHSPQGYSLLAAFLAEALLTFFFLMIILGSTDRRASAALAPVSIGLGLTLIHLISIPVTNTSVNPARSTGPALVVAALGNSELLGQVWLFWVAPILGGILAGWVYYAIFEESLRSREADVVSMQ